MKTALILPPTAPSFQRVAGLPLIQRTVLAVLRCDFDRVVVIGGEYTEQLRAVLRADERTRAVEISPEMPTITGAHVTVIPSDCVLTPATLARLLIDSGGGRGGSLGESSLRGLGIGLVRWSRGPGCGEQLLEPALLPTCGEPLEDVAGVRPRIDPVQTARAEHGVDHGRALGALV